MLQYCDPSLEELPDFSSAQLDGLTKRIEAKKKQLEADISNYIRRKQEQLSKEIRELTEEYRGLERAESTRDANAKPLNNETQFTDSSADSRKLSSGDTAKRTKHTRVHKREKELCGLVTPIFLPLLDASTSPIKKKKEKRRPTEELSASESASSPWRDAEESKEESRPRSRSRDDPMEHGESATSGGSSKENTKPEAVVKKKRAAAKKSSLRHMTTPRAKRKRVSLIIDDQIVLPADNIAEPPLVSPAKTTASSNSNSNSATSLSDSIDPRLISGHDTPAGRGHQDPVHHSLISSTKTTIASPTKTAIASPTKTTIASPTKHKNHVCSESPPALEYMPPQTATRTFLDPSPPQQKVILPQYSSMVPIYADEGDITEGDITEGDITEGDEEEEFSTYVGGIDGSGVDNVNQVGSYGYPSSLGASYLESYIKNRPLSVRVVSAEKAELAEDEKKALINGETEIKKENVDLDIEDLDDADDADDTMDIIGEMEGL
ncbi:hypothetical protein K504DRAFT_368340 [Pleomassaria siparia CBS 279.74]|uniref:Uncharacterized protein n=1 Tax=Pleomassaria siparia CBS 279.74 TaxID=1314801 RepID=A0A6G1KPE9_9PLEO|nr:hypothetical protein K504DRAFT_368340 [Pleomassaria siparia CBS 279.74]